MRRSYVLALLSFACGPRGATPSTATPEQAGAPAGEADTTAQSAREVLDALEAKIAVGSDREKDRVSALERVEAMADDGTADYAFARAALAGRVAENRGAGAGKLVTEAETWARAALERDPDYRDGAAARMLGSLYVLAPGRLVEHGDSEDGLTMLEDLVDARPDDPINHLRLAEAYIHLGDVDPSREHLCLALGAEASLRPDERKLLGRLVEDAGGPDALGCEPVR